ncbi:MAG: hypothetical protein NXY57DRAFT_1029143 [Lentinula lateritia]|nr:MAG: hypothetical protein NXY57DRAFT_1029143 [Lentinula lateritia]
MVSVNRKISVNLGILPSVFLGPFDTGFFASWFPFHLVLIARNLASSYMIIAEGDRISNVNTYQALSAHPGNRAVACILTSVCLPQLDRRILDSQPRTLESTQLALPVNSCDPIALLNAFHVLSNFNAQSWLSLACFSFFCAVISDELQRERHLTYLQSKIACVFRYLEH